MVGIKGLKSVYSWNTNARFNGNSRQNSAETSSGFTRRAFVKTVQAGLLAAYFLNSVPAPVIGAPEPQQRIEAKIPAGSSLTPVERQKLDDLLREIKIWDKSFQFFEDARIPENGLFLDRMPNSPNSPLNSKKNLTVSLAATGYGLTMDVLKAERGYFGANRDVSRQKVAERLNKTLDSVEKLSHPANGNFLPHFVRGDTLENMAEISTIDTMIFYMGAIAAGQYCGGEALARVEAMFNRLDFEMMRTREGNAGYKESDNFSHGKDKDGNFILHHWGGPYSEGVLLLNLISLGSRQNVPTSVWKKGWDRTNEWASGDKSTFTKAPLFISFYGSGFLNLKGLKDDQGTDFWQANQDAVRLHMDYCRDYGYPTSLFGLTACDAPPPIGYKAYAPGQDDGTIAPPAIIASLPLAEREVYEALQKLKSQNLLETGYGPVNAYNVRTGWQSTDALGIDMGSMMLMLDAYETGTIHKLISESTIIQQALKRAGFQELNPGSLLSQTRN